MKENRGLYIAAIVVLGLALGLIGRSAYRMYFRHKPAVVDTVSEELKKVRANDLAVLKENSADELQIATSLKRYADQNLPEGLPLIRQYLKDERPQVQAAALEAAGAYGEADFFQALEQGLSAENPTVRIGALRGLGRRAEELRQKLLSEYLVKTPPTDGEWFEAHLAKYKVNSDERLRQETVGEIMKRAAGWELELQNNAYYELYMIAPNSPALIAHGKELLQNKFAVSQHARLLPIVFNYVQAYDRKWINAQLLKLPIHGDYGYQQALVQFMINNCPVGWQELAKNMSDPVVTRLHPGEVEQSGLAQACR